MLPKVFDDCDLISIMDESIGSRLKRIRKAEKLTQAGLAGKVGLVQTAICNIEVDQRGYGVSIIDIARVLRVSPAYLRLETNDPTLWTPRRPSSRRLSTP
jgi:transcriptional regulator with XRE-family HTH domain